MGKSLSPDLCFSNSFTKAQGKLMGSEIILRRYNLNIFGLEFQRENDDFEISAVLEKL